MVTQDCKVCTAAVAQNKGVCAEDDTDSLLQQPLLVWGRPEFEGLDGTIEELKQDGRLNGCMGP